jgi:4-amino-4-deoxy-L-arabinose transferase-like glycosyltransferase
MSVRNRTVLVVAVLILAATPVRLVNLGALSFYGDEETSAMPALSFAEGNGSRMPSGMEYRRALPLTWLNAATARFLGLDSELAYRLPTALLGILTVPLLFLAGRSFGTARAAFIAALLLAFSEWHLVFSRQARMYVPFLFFFIAGAWAIWNWATTGKRGWLLFAIPMAAGAVTMHRLGLMVTMFALLPLVLPGRTQLSIVKLVTFAAIVTVVGSIYHEYFVNAPYRAWPPASLAAAVVGDSVPEATAQGPQGWPLLLILRGFIGGVVGALATQVALRANSQGSPPLGQVAVFLAGTTAGVLAWSGQLYGACIAGIVWLILLPGDRSGLVKRLRSPVALVVLPATLWLVVAILGQGLREGIKSVSVFPYPYPLYLAEQFPLLLVLFGGACLVLALREATQQDRPARAAVLAALLPIVAVGAVSRWEGTRYLFAAYPFLLLAASSGLVSLIDLVGKRIPRWTANGTAMLGTTVALSGVIGGHGLWQAIRVVRLEHGEPINTFVHMYPFRPDHASAGHYVREHRMAHDVVIAEDPLEQWWYAGDPINYWLRSYGDSRAFLFSTPRGEVRDIYVGSRLLTAPLPPDSLLESPEGRVWLITSGETFPLRSYFLNPAQERWLDSLETAIEPSFVGRDGVTKVYCLNCQTRSSGG